MSGLQKNITAVSFGKDKYGLTEGQLLIIKLLNDRLKEGKPVTREDIRETYNKAIAPTGKKDRWEYDIDSGYKLVSKDIRSDWRSSFYSMQWFQYNLGSCIIKGKILAVPVIEV